MPDLAGALHGVVFGNTRVLEEKPDEVAAFNTAIGASLDLIASDEAEARELLGQYLEGTDPAVLDGLMPILVDEVAGQVGVAEDA